MRQDTSPDQTHTIAPFAIAIAVDELYHASYGDTPPAQMIWKKQKVGSVNKKGFMRPDVFGRSVDHDNVNGQIIKIANECESQKVKVNKSHNLN